jgi:hypothetical protein
MSAQIHLTKKERQVYFYKLLLLYGLGLLLFSVIIFWKSSTATAGRQQNDWKNSYAESQQVAEAQIKAVQIIDSMSSNMQLLKGEARQIFLERDIQNLSRQLRGLYNEQSADLRYVSFLQASDLMNMRLEDVQTMNKKLGNIKIFEQQLSECQIGIKVRQGSN